MNLSKLCWVAVLGAIIGCGDANGGTLGSAGSSGSGGAGGEAGSGGTGEPPIVDQTRFRLSCDYDTLELDIPIELIVELTKPYSRSGGTEATFSATWTLDEKSVASFLGAGITVIDIVSASVSTTLTGAIPAAMTSTYGAAPINDFDLLGDPDDNGTPGPHRFELDRVTVASKAATGATEVAFDLQFPGISIALGDFNIPANCLGPSLVGFVLRFPVD